MNTHVKTRFPRAALLGRPTLPFWIFLALAAAFALSTCQGTYAQSMRVEEIIARALALPPDMAAGAELYQRACSDCHGPKGQGDGRQVIPSIAGQVPSYLVKQLADIAEGDRSAPDMHRVAARAELSRPEALNNVARYLAALPPLATPEVGDGKRLPIGERIYNKACAQCHGESGAGLFGDMVPALRGQHYSYLLSETRRLPVGHRYSVDIDALEQIEALSLDEASAVADYISRLPPTPYHSGSVSQLNSVKTPVRGQTGR